MAFASDTFDLWACGCACVWQVSKGKLPCEFDLTPAGDGDY